MAVDIVVHPRVHSRHPGISEEDVVAVNRTYEPPDIYAAAGVDGKGRMLEVLGVELEDGSFLVYHAMKLTAKMRRELGLG